MERLVAPAVAPITLAEAKEHLRVDHSDEDALIGGIIAAAVSHIDGDGLLGRAMITQTWAQWVSRAPGNVRLRMGPFIALAGVAFWDADSLEDADTADFRVRKVGDFVEIAAKNAWPAADDRPDAIRISFTAGYGATADDVPADIRHALLLLVGHLYANREATREKALAEIPLGVDALIGRHRAGWYG